MKYSEQASGRRRAILRMHCWSLSILVCACATPKAKYYNSQEPYPDTQGLLQFALQGGLVTVAVKPSAEQAPTGKGSQTQEQLTALGLAQGQKKAIQSADQLKTAQSFVTQTDAAGPLYLIEPNDDFLTQANLSVTYFEGHHVLKTIGTDFQDNTVKIIEGIGAVAVALVGVFGYTELPQPAPDDLELPVVFDFSDPAKFANRNVYADWVKIPGHTQWWYRYKVSGPTGVRVFKTKEWFAKNKGKWTVEFPIAACTELTLEIGQGKDVGEVERAKGTYVMQIVDPSYIEPLPFPRKGTITMHTTCGADIAVQGSQAGTTFAVLEAVGKQVEAVLQAQTKARQQKKGAGTSGGTK